MKLNEYTEDVWRDTYTKAGGVGTCMSHQWLLNGCPVCGCKKWTVTSDYWAYCEECHKGYSTDYPFTSALLSLLDAEGVHCWRCNGFGGRCEGCSGHRTRPDDTAEVPPAPDGAL